MEPSEGNTKLFGTWIKQWKDILSQISNSIKLLGLIVLVLSTLITFVFLSTPVRDRNFAIYLYVLLGLLLIVIIGIFIDRQNERKAKKSNDGTLVLTKDNELEIQKKAVTTDQVTNQNFIDSAAGFKIYQSEKIGWQKPKRLSYKELLLKLGFVKNIQEVENMLKVARISNPLSSLFATSENIMFQYGDDIEIKFKDDSTLQKIEDYLDNLKKYLLETENKTMTADEIQAERKEQFSGGSPSTCFIFPVNLNVMVLQKKHFISKATKLNLPNLLMSIISNTGESIDQLLSYENSIICVTQSKMLNVKVNEVVENLTIYRIYKLIDAKEKIFLLQTQWCPESDSAIEVWEELKKMQDSFTIID